LDLPHTHELQSVLETADDAADRMAQHLLRWPCDLIDARRLLCRFRAAAAAFQHALGRLEELAIQSSPYRSPHTMDSVRAEIFPTAQPAALPPPKGDRPPSSWAEGELTPGQFFRPVTDTAAGWTAERKLLLAVFRNAVDSLVRYRNDHTIRGTRLLRETHDWVWSADRQWLCSFENICAYLHLDAEYIRRGLKRLYNPAAVASAPSPTAPRRRRRTNRHVTAVRGGGAGRNR
jgi:hypothetical protein